MNRTPAAVRLHSFIYRSSRRLADLVLASVGLLLLAPLLLLTGLLICVLQGWPPLYLEPRLGQHRRPFTLIKFRTLANNHDKNNTKPGTSVAALDDPRLRPLGRWLRRTHLDELPQLLNIIAGHMSLVGPRPLKPAHAACLPADKLLSLLSVRPGLTGADAIAFMAEDGVLVGHTADPQRAEALYLQYLLPAKADLQLAYVRQRCWRLDLQLLARTIGACLSPAAYASSAAQLRRLLPADDAHITYNRRPHNYQ
jgi:lipopolysaccharide/colanic/teichoic acid biosynthesis glycosyltransferase